MGVVMQDGVRRAMDGHIGVEAAWPRVAAAVRRRADRRGLSEEDTDELLHRVQVAVVRRAPFRSPRAAERYGLVVAFSEMKALIDAAEASSVVVVLSLEALEEAAAEGDGESEVAARHASRADSPEDRAVFRAAFAEALAALDPAPTANDLVALLHPLREAPYPSRKEQVLWGVRAHRIRGRLREAVSDLLAPAVAPIGGWWRGRRRLRPLVSAAGLGGAVWVAVPALLLATRSPATMTLPDQRPAGAQMAGTAESAPVPAQAPTVSSARRVGEEIPRGRGEAAGEPPATVRAGLWREGTTTRAAAQITVRVEAVEGTTGNDLAATVYCDTPVRAAVCAAVPVEQVPR